MLPSRWPSWSLIPIALSLVVVVVGLGLLLEPAVQAITPVVESSTELPGFPTPLPYAASQSESCIECHASEERLTDAGGSPSDLPHLLVAADSTMTLHGRLGCVTCHGGTPATQDVDSAHENLVTNPSTYQDADTYCLPCHHELRTQIPEHNIQTPHERILWGVHEDEEVCACSNCHGPVAHGEEPIRTHDFLASYCIECHEEQNVPPERHRCSGCHVGPHDVSQAMDCETCHDSTQTWSSVQLAVHPMELQGAHGELDCFECHLRPDFRHISGFECSDCHTKPHDFGGDDCGTCHVDVGEWTAIQEDEFDHLALWEGYRHHEDVACEGCHFVGYDLSTECSSCHLPEATPTPEPSPTPQTTEAADVDEIALLSEHVTARLADWKPVITADALYENLNDGDETNDPFILSVRSREHYELGHVPGAYNIPWRQIANPEHLAKLPRDRQIVAYCYTGHTGQVAATILNVLGYDVTNLKFGMMGWTDDAEVLATDPFAGAAGYPVETEVNELTETYGLPRLDMGETEATAIARDRAEAFLADWKPVMTAEALFENLNDGDATNDPFILSVRSAEHYAVGHVPGAHNVPWKQVATMENLAYLPTDQPIVDYCYTGHTGQVAATVLGLFGYDVTNLKFGMMGWTDDAEVLATDPFVGPAGYPLETKVNELAAVAAAVSDDEFTLLAEQITIRLADWKPVLTADALYENLNDGDESNDPFILSVRSREHYELGHVPGAYNISWRQIANPENLAKLPRDRQIVAYCYTGHTGQVAATILNVLGYDVTNLKYGMMGWTDDAEVLATDPFARAAGYPVETGVNGLTETHDLPTLDMGETEAAAIARARAEAFLADWKPVMTADVLYENLNDGDAANDPFIVSVRSAEHYDVGHVPGAHNVGWRQVAMMENLQMLPTDTPIVSYCYTGHTGQVAATSLGLLGYDVTNLKFGMMGWTDDAEVLATDPFAGAAGYPVETEPNELGS